MSPNVSKASKAIVFIISPFVSMPFIYEASINHFTNLRSVPFYFFRRSREPFVKRPRINCRETTNGQLCERKTYTAGDRSDEFTNRNYK
jgi:hypothetical protein